MPALFIKLQKKFSVSNEDGSDPVVPDFNNLSSIKLNVSIYNPDQPAVSFRINSGELESGHITGTVVGDKVDFDVDAIAKLNVKPGYVDEFLDSGTRWEFGGVDGIVGVYDGLETESYEEYNRFHDKTYTFKRYFVQVSTGKKVKDLG